ncbi:hypothetical protein [Aliiglaciecola aliphaticivorans]
MSYADLFNLPASPYFLSHSVGCLAKKSELSLAENFLTPWKLSGGDAWQNWLNTVELFCTALGQLLNANSADFCPQTNLSSGLTKWLMALPTHSHKIRKRKVLMHEDAFPSMGYVVKAMQPLGFELVLIPAAESAANIQTWQRYVHGDIHCVLATHVHSNQGRCRLFKVLLSCVDNRVAISQWTSLNQRAFCPLICLFGTWMWFLVQV